jgi:hypothetical protein
MFAKGEVGNMKSSHSSANPQKSLAIIALVLAASLVLPAGLFAGGGST